MNIGMRTKSDLLKAARAGIRREKQMDALRVATVAIVIFLIFVVAAVAEEMTK